jgi:hypothetical protein
VIDVRFTPDATKLLRSSEMTRCAKSRREQMQRRAVLFDHLVGAGEKHRRHFQAECVRSFEVDDESRA